LQVRTSAAGTLAPKSGSALGTGLAPTKALKAHEDDVIRHTVTQLRGNVAAAAVQLGISRATIYRKLGKPRR
jgi:sigma-54 dependent transcriptional regulator, acetoin dehydrogenase operon transcriptional activator AcoR